MNDDPPTKLASVSDITRPPRYVTTREAWQGSQWVPRPPSYNGDWHLVSTAAAGTTVFYTWENAEEFYD